MAVYKCHHRCVCIHGGSYRLLDVLLPRQSALCISFPPVVSGPDASILIPTCYHPFQPPSRFDEIWMCASLCCPIPVCLKVSLMPIYCVPKSRQLAAVPVFCCFPVLLTICLSQRDEIWMHVFSLSLPLLFFFSLLPLTGYFNQVSLWLNMNACPLSFSPPLTECLSCASQQDEI